jgi:hypothetical protein
MIYNIYDLVELALISLLILIQWYVILDTIFLLSENNNHEFFDQRIIKIGLFGLLLWAARLIRKKDMAVLIILIPVIIILYTLLLKFINNNFSI